MTCSQGEAWSSAPLALFQGQLFKKSGGGIEKSGHLWLESSWVIPSSPPSSCTLRLPARPPRGSVQLDPGGAPPSHVPRSSLLHPQQKSFLLLASVMSDSVRPHRRQPTRLPRPWDSPGKNTGVGCHFLLQCMKVKSDSEVAQSCPTPSDPMDCSPPGSSIHGIFQARVLEWGAIAFSRNHFCFLLIFMCFMPFLLVAFAIFHESSVSFLW